MKAVGIVAEYNPFHQGHKYHAAEARKRAHADAVVAVMSGNFTQRGEPTIVDKWTRARMALVNGVDLVVELPYRCAVQPADLFAKAGIEILSALQCDSFAFGAEADDMADLESLVAFYAENQKAIATSLHKLPANLVFAKRMQLAIEENASKNLKTQLWSEPNNQLAIHYLLANSALASPMEPIAIQRPKGQHDDSQIKGNRFASGTAIRQSLQAGKLAKDVVPSATYTLLQEKQLVTMTDYWPYLQYQLAVNASDQLADIYQMTEGLENRLLKQFKPEDSLASYLNKIKSKRYTYSRLVRLLNYVLVQASNSDMITDSVPSAIRLLGFTQTGQAYLNIIKASTNVEIVSRLSQANAENFAMDIRAGRVYRLAAPERITSQDFKRQPIRM